VRRLDAGVYRYRARRSSAELLRGAVQRFVERSLDGSVAPFLAYLSDAPRLSDAELSELEEVVSKLQAVRRKETP
jgi:predicted transcriptional regulator